MTARLMGNRSQTTPGRIMPAASRRARRARPRLPASSHSAPSLWAGRGPANVFVRKAARAAGGNEAMLFLTRKVGESIVINDDIEVTVVEVRGRSIKLGFTFPPEAKVLRRELHDRIKAEGRSPATNGAAVPTKDV